MDYKTNKSIVYYQIHWSESLNNLKQLEVLSVYKGKDISSTISIVCII